MERCKYYINTTMEEAKKIRFPFNWIGGGEKVLDHSGNENLHASQAVCQQLFSSCYITVDGYVTPCSANPDPRIINFGNLLRQNFNEIWNNSQYIQLREEIKKGKIPQFCKDCTIVHI
jgi:radical SAM protein with 4Fe4S-binding SPASM domain